MGKRPLNVAVGDVFAGPVGNGRFGAVHVIAAHPRSVTVVCTTYLGPTVPLIDDRALRKVLRRTRFSYENQPAIMIVDEPLPADFVLVGNFAPTAAEKAIDPMGTYGSGWSVIDDVFMEWRWEHERDAYVKEVEAARAARIAQPPSRPTARKRTPRSTLTERDFWKLVGLGEKAAAALAKRSKADIREFAEILAHKLYLLDGKQYAKQAGAAGGSDDAFLYARCFVVGQGKAFFDDVLANPKKFPKDADYEELLGVADAAHIAKTDDDLEADTHYSYETGSNAEGWPT